MALLSINGSRPEFDTLQLILHQIDQEDELLNHIKQRKLKRVASKEALD